MPALLLPLRFHLLEEFRAAHLRRDQRADLPLTQPVTLSVGQSQPPEHLLLHRHGGEHLMDALPGETELLADLVQGYALSAELKGAAAHLAVGGRAMTRSYPAAATRALNVSHLPLSFLFNWHVAPLCEWST